MSFETVALAASGAGVSALDSFSKWQQAKFDEDVADANVGIVRENAAIEEERVRRDRIRKIGAAEAAFGAAGVDLMGTPLDVLADLTVQKELDALNVRRKGQLGVQVQLTQKAGAEFRQKWAIIEGLTGAGGDIATETILGSGTPAEPFDNPAAPPTRAEMIAGI
jgi:hypothetical protein